jgi:hypothetical protein
MAWKLLNMTYKQFVLQAISVVETFTHYHRLTSMSCNLSSCSHAIKLMRRNHYRRLLAYRNVDLPLPGYDAFGGPALEIVTTHQFDL